jgi:perosamine synthetase
MAEPRIPVFRPWIAHAARTYVLDCLDTGWLSSMGAYVRRFEADFAKLCDAGYGVATSSGTTALHLALAAAGIGPGDEVIVPALTFVATANAVVYTGARAVIADVDPATWTLDPADVARRRTPRTRAVIAVHLYGHPADLDALRAAAGPSVLLVEDAAEAHGARYKGRPVGAVGDAGCFSFYGNKMITTGEGGMLVTDDARVATRASFLRDHAMEASPHYFHSAVGFNYRMTNLQAAVGCGQLEEFSTMLARKRQISTRYGERLAHVRGLGLPPQAPWAENVYWMYSVLVPADRARDVVTAALAEVGVETRPFFVPLHLLPPYASEEPRPVSEGLARHGINLPSGPTLSDADVDRVCAALVDALQ